MSDKLVFCGLVLGVLALVLVLAGVDLLRKAVEERESGRVKDAQFLADFGWWLVFWAVAAVWAAALLFGVD